MKAIASSIGKYFLYLIVCSGFLLVPLEFVSRLIRPINHGVRRSDLDGNIIRIGSNDPNTKFWQVSNEYKVITTIDKYGQRIVPSSDKNSKYKLIFLGDSFAYGQGLNDKNTIPNLTCAQLKNIDCINLGFPGSGSIQQKQKLIAYLNSIESRGGKVIHLILASTTQNYSGNDITDTINTLRKRNSSKNLDNASLKESKNNYFIETGRQLTNQSNLLRLLRFYIGDHIKILAFLFPQDKISTEVLMLYGETIERIGKESEKRGYEYIPILLSPLSEVSHKRVERSRDDIQAYISYNLLAPKYPKKQRDINSIYFRLDGHFNNKGSKMAADYILEMIDR